MKPMQILKKRVMYRLGNWVLQDPQSSAGARKTYSSADVLAVVALKSQAFTLQTIKAALHQGKQPRRHWVSAVNWQALSKQGSQCGGSR
jgi:hypothetical protein